jgi:hypothetical protein
MKPRIDIAADGLVTDTEGKTLGQLTARGGSVMLYTEAGGRLTIETDSLKGLRFELSSALQRARGFSLY